MHYSSLKWKQTMKTKMITNNKKEEMATIKKNLKHNLLLFFVTSLLCFIFLELFLRSFWAQPGYGYPEGLIIPDDTKGFAFQPHFRGTFTGMLYKDIPISINSKGLRDDEHEYLHPTSFRILGIGDSATFSPGVSYENTYLRQLEKQLQHEEPSMDIIKAGFNSYEIDQEHTWFFEEGYKYQPNLVLIGVALNDVNPAKAHQNSYTKGLLKVFFVKDRSSFGSLKTFFEFYCYTCTFLDAFFYSFNQRTLIHGKEYDLDYFERFYKLWEGETFEQYQNKLLQIHTYLQKRDIPLVLVIFPYTYQFTNSLNFGTLPQDQLKTFAQQHDIFIIDLLPVLDVEDYETYYLYEDEVHLSAKGNIVIAAKINEFLEKHHLLQNA